MNRRRFLLFAGQIGLVGILGCDNLCSAGTFIPNLQQGQLSVNQKKLKQSINKLLEEGKKISLRWNCGGDELILDTFLDDKKMPFDDPMAMELSLYVANLLNLPDVGEFAMEGEGQILKEAGLIFLECESIMKGYEGYSEQGEPLGWQEVNEVEPAYTLKKTLFEEQ